MNGEKKKPPWRCRVFGCDLDMTHGKLIQITDSIAAEKMTCTRCGRMETMFVLCPSPGKMERYREAEECMRIAEGSGRADKG